MAYKLLQVSDFDPAELVRVNLRGITSHDEAVERIQRHSLGWSWTHQSLFRELGVDCRTVIPASATVRRLALPPGAEGAATAAEASLAYLLQAVGQDRPQVVFLDNPSCLEARAIHQLRDRPDPPLLITHFCAALSSEAETNLAAYDLVLCCSPHFLARAEAKGARAQLHYHAAPPPALALPLPPVEARLRRACFVGSIVPGSRYHSRRLQLLRQVCRVGVPVDVYSDPPTSRWIQAFRRRMGGESWLVGRLEGLHRRLGRDAPLQRALKPPVYGAAMFHTMQRHLCAINVHAGMAQGWAANMRLFEAAALGVCLITEDHPNLADLFEPDLEILTYRSAAELVKRLRHCLAHPQEACAIGERARQRALACHQSIHRVAELHATLLRRLEQRG
ncbi:MAG: glycosyltransferase [Synechococcaceae cyanobacterium]|nr:glycosyltransferase [Synechococcaceae cyanobacterium]